MSNGAMMSWRLACEAPEIRAIAPVEGTDNTTHCTPPHPVPVIQFHAIDDEMVAFNGGPGPSSFTKVISRRSRQPRRNGLRSTAPTRSRSAC